MIRAFLLISVPLLSGAAETRELSRTTLHDKIAGGWAGQMIGVSFGAPTEFRSNGRINEGELPKWTPDRVSNSLEQDDLYVDMTFAKVIDEKGIGATSDDFGMMFVGRFSRKDKAGRNMTPLTATDFNRIWNDSLPSPIWLEQTSRSREEVWGTWAERVGTLYGH